MKSITHIDYHRPEHNRAIVVAGGACWEVQMTAELWESHDLLKQVEGVTETEMAAYALDEMLLQEVGFDEAYRGVVAYLASRWKERDA